MRERRLIKRRYYDIRQAWSLIAPIFGYANFVLLFYNFTDLKKLIEFNIFIPIFTIGMGILFVFIGRAYRKKQMSTDMDLSYERGSQGARTARIMLEFQRDVMKQLKMTVPQELIDRIEYLHKIELNKV